MKKNAETRFSNAKKKNIHLTKSTFHEEKREGFQLGSYSIFLSSQQNSDIKYKGNSIPLKCSTFMFGGKE